MADGPRNCVPDRGQTSTGPLIEATGSGATFNTISFVSVQPFNWATVKRKVALEDETWAVVVKELGDSMVAVPDTTLQAVETMGNRPGVALP